MKQLADFKIIAHDWVYLMQEHANVHLNKKETIEDELEKQRLQPLGSKADYQILLPGNYLWITITRDSTKEFFYYQPDESLNRFMNLKLKAEAAELNFFKLEYLTLLALSMINRLKDLFAYHEKLIEYSSVNTNGLWKPSEKNSFFIKRLKDKKFYTYIDEFKEGPQAFDLTTIQKMFCIQESNFKSCFDSDVITAMLQSESNL